MPRPGGRLQNPSESEQRSGLKCEDEQDRRKHRDEIRGGGHGRRADSLEDPRLAPRHDDEREAGESGVGRSVAEHPGEQRPRRRSPVDATVVQGGEEREEQEREEEDEDGGFPAPPEHELLPAKLVQEEPHSSSPAVISR